MTQREKGLRRGVVLLVVGLGLLGGVIGFLAGAVNVADNWRTNIVVGAATGVVPAFLVSSIMNR